MNKGQVRAEINAGGIVTLALFTIARKLTYWCRNHLATVRLLGAACAGWGRLSLRSTVTTR
jgi:hypothetical protein